MKAKNCPWCDRRYIRLWFDYKETKRYYYLHCTNCGYEGRRSKFIFLAVWKWNHEYKHLKRHPDGIRKYHMKGREF